MQDGPGLAMKTQLVTQMDSADVAVGLRDQAALDLLRRIPALAPRSIANLSGGADNAQDLLAGRFPEANIVSIEYGAFAPEPSGSEHDLLQYRPFRVGGVRSAQAFDLIFSNGSLETLPSFRQLAPALLSLTRPGGWLAFQIPNNLHEPNRQLLRMVAVDGPWAEKLCRSRKPDHSTKPWKASIQSSAQSAPPSNFWRRPMSTGWTAPKPLLIQCAKPVSHLFWRRSMTNCAGNS